MLFKTIIFSDAPILKGFRYRDRFQLVPYYYSKFAPSSVYARHFPAFLEYEADLVEEELGFEDTMKINGLNDKEINKCQHLPNQERVKREILQLLTCLTNYHFFSYDSVSCWGIQAPSHELGELTEEDITSIETPTSQWTIGCYIYPELKNEISIDNYTKVRDYYSCDSTYKTYFTNNPGAQLTPELSFPAFIEFCIDQYFGLDETTYKRVKHCIGLLTDGIALFDTKRSVSLLAIISSIEGMAHLDLELYGEHKDLGAKNRFLRYLKNYVAGLSEEKFKLYYEKRCEIAHESKMFVGDIDIFSDSHKQHKDWLLRLEIQQSARIALYNWLRTEH